MRYNMENIQQQNLLLKPEIILRFLTKNDEDLDTLIMCNSVYLNLYCFDQSIYEALGSMDEKQRKNVNMNKLTKLFEVVDIVSQREQLKKPKEILREEKVEEIRKNAEQSFTRKND